MGEQVIDPVRGLAINKNMDSERSIAWGLGWYKAFLRPRIFEES